MASLGLSFTNWFQTHRETEHATGSEQQQPVGRDQAQATQPGNSPRIKGSQCFPFSSQQTSSLWRIHRLLGQGLVVGLTKYEKENVCH